MYKEEIVLSLLRKFKLRELRNLKQKLENEREIEKFVDKVFLAPNSPVYRLVERNEMFEMVEIIKKCINTLIGKHLHPKQDKPKSRAKSNRKTTPET